MLRPFDARVVVQKPERKEQTASGIILPDGVDEAGQTAEGVVVSVGQGSRNMTTGEYMEIPKKLNFNPSNIEYSIEKFNEIYENIICIHYNGKLKPWTVKGILEKDSIIFQNEYRKLGLNKFLITHIWRWNSLLYFLLSFINLKFFGVNKKYFFTYEFFKSLFKKD